MKGTCEELVSRSTKPGDKVLDPPQRKKHMGQREGDQAKRWLLELSDNRGPNNAYMGNRSEERENQVRKNNQTGK